MCFAVAFFLLYGLIIDRGAGMMKWFLGTIGFTYPEWKGSFYPSGLPSNQSLAYYSKIYNAVEINTTFYGPQPAAQIQRWLAATPAEFRFTLKAPKRVTHDLRLKNADMEMRAFLDSALGLGEKLGAVLLQLPPSFKASDKPDLEAFLSMLRSGPFRDGPRYAIEFRHPSWHVPETAALLRAYQVCWVATDYEDLPADITPTTDFLYIRWIGKHNVIPHPGHEVLDRTDRQRDWFERIQAVLLGQGTVFGFFDNDYAGHAPASCNRMKSLAGLPVTAPPPEEQGRLF
jgi:uncharacterized protein YecE (DUF72 family)